jgi:hypothetical protein
LAGLSLSFPLAPGCSRGTNHPPHTTHTPTNHALLSFFLFPRRPSHPEHPFSLYLHRPLASNSIASNSIEYSIRGILSQTSLDRECIESRESSLSPPAHHIHAAIFTPRLRPQLPTPQPLTIPIIRVADLPKPGTIPTLTWSFAYNLRWSDNSLSTNTRTARLPSCRTIDIVSSRLLFLRHRRRGSWYGTRSSS